MSFLRQSTAAAQISFLGLSTRIGTSLVIVISMACVIGVSVAMLSVTAGLMRAYETGADPGRAVVISAHAPDEYGCNLPRSSIGTIMDAPHIARETDGHASADAELTVYIATPQATSNGILVLRGVGPAGLELRPGFKITAGRLFKFGRQELVIGVSAQRRLGLKVGDTIIMPNGEWPIVGTFHTGGLVDHQLIADAETISSATHTNCFGSVLARLDSPDALNEFKQWLTSNPALAVTAERQSDYVLRTATRDSAYFTAIAYLVGAIMAVGAVFASVKILYGSVDARRREIATLRALGYGPLAIGMSVIFESLILSLTGALVGVAVAWLVFDGSTSKAFELSVSAQLVTFGFECAAVLAVLSAVPAAWRAARLPAADALKAMQL
jgi:putative ABC transport system permease protein